MSEKTKAQGLIAGIGLLVSLGLAVGLAFSLDGGPSPTGGKWSILLFIPFVILNPFYLLAPVLDPIVRPLPEWSSWVILLAVFLGWWWFIGGVAARKLGKRQV